MGLIFNSAAPMEKIYENYGVTVEGRWNRYESAFGENHDALVNIKIGNYERNFGNNAPFETNIDRHIDNICYYIAKYNPDKETLDSIMVDTLEKNVGIWSYKIDQEKSRDRIEKQIEQEQKERKQKEKQELEEKIRKLKMNKKIEKLAKDLMSYERSFATEKDGRYFIFHLHQILETPYPVDGIEYSNDYKNILTLLRLMDEGKEDYKIFTINDDIKEGIKKVAGRKYSQRVIWHGGNMYPYVNARYVQKCQEALKCKEMRCGTMKQPIIFYYKDQENALIKMLILPINHGGAEHVGFKNIDTGEMYVREE